MFPYPSGRIHMGHVRNYTMGDVLARYPPDAGLRSAPPDGLGRVRHAGRECGDGKKVHPGEWTRANIETMRGQLKRLGFALDWSRELATCDPDYYGHEQALFLDLFEAGPRLSQGERGQLGSGRHDRARQRAGDRRPRLALGRSGRAAQARQWFLKITDFADELLDGLEALEDWPDKVRLMQENWIGKSQGLRFRFRSLPKGPAPNILGWKQRTGFEVFTTRPDTIFGASFARICRPITRSRRRWPRNPDVAAFIAECRAGGTSAAEIETQEKLGFDTGSRSSTRSIRNGGCRCGSRTSC
jgi:leucyl-tRNA synthetase